MHVAGATGLLDEGLAMRQGGTVIPRSADFERRKTEAAESGTDLKKQSPHELDPVAVTAEARNGESSAMRESADDACDQRRRDQP